VSRPRFHLPQAVGGVRLALPEHAAHHARDVLRLSAGAAVCVFDGAGQEYDALLERVTRREVVIRVGGRLAACPEPSLPVTLAVSPLKGDRMEWVIQKAVELGVHAILPVICVRTDAAARPALKGTRQERWNKVASGATEQCGRAAVPQVAPTRRLEELLADPPPGMRLLFDGGAEGPGLRAREAPAAVLVLVGPPGGWEPAERSAALDAGFSTVTMGPRVLRSETAAVAAVTAVQLLWGDLG